MRRPFVLFAMLFCVAGSAADTDPFVVRLMEWRRSSLEKFRGVFSERMEASAGRYRRELAWRNDLLAEIDKEKDFPVDKAAYRRYVEDVSDRRLNLLLRAPQLIEKTFGLATQALDNEMERRLRDGNVFYWDEATWPPNEESEREFAADERLRETLVLPSALRPKEAPKDVDKLDEYNGTPFFLTIGLGDKELPKTEDPAKVREAFYAALRGEKQSLLKSDSKGNLYMAGQWLTYKFEVKHTERQTNVPFEDKAAIEAIVARYRHLAYEHMVRKPRVEAFAKVLAQDYSREREAAVRMPFAIHGKTPMNAKLESNDLLVEDRFGRVVNTTGIQLVDWDGYIANPAFRYRLRAPKGMKSPLLAQLTVNNANVYFDNPTDNNADGPRKVVAMRSDITDTPEAEFYISVWPDRETQDKAATLTVEYWEAPLVDTDLLSEKPPPNRRKITVPIAITDEDRKSEAPPVVKVQRPTFFPFVEPPKDSRPLRPGFPYLVKNNDRPARKAGDFTITVDYSEDDSRFFSNNDDASILHQAIVDRAAGDWADLLAEQGVEETKVGVERTNILRYNEAGEQTFREVANKVPFRDFLLYVTASNNLPKPHASGGAEGAGFHRPLSGPIRLKLSGQIVAEGVSRDPGFSAEPKEELWREARFNADSKRDLYSAMLHEIGHALFAHKSYPTWGKWLEAKGITDRTIQYYAHGEPKIDKDSHFADETDFASQKAAYGAIRGRMLQRKWLLTKMDVLMLNAVGYKTRELSFLKPLTFNAPAPEPAKLGKAYSLPLKITGGLPPYMCTIAGGALPDGLTLNTFTGEISGTPKDVGTYVFLIRARDNADPEAGGHIRAMEITVKR